MEEAFREAGRGSGVDQEAESTEEVTRRAGAAAPTGGEQ